MKRISLFTRLSMFLVAAVMMQSCAVNPVTGKRQIMLVSESAEAGMGAEYHPQVMATFGEYKDPQLQDFVNRVGNDIVKISHRPELKFTFSLLDSPVVNAFAVPGGYVYLTRGILGHLNSEAELVGVLGHEIGHVTARHTAQQQTNAQLAQLGLIVGMIAAPQFAQFADLASAGLQLLFLSFSRDHERQSDDLGVDYSTKIGYDASQVAEFFKVLKAMQLDSEQGGIPTFLSTHPDPGDRYNDIKEKAKIAQANDNAHTTYKVNEESYLRMIDGIIYGEDPRQGYTEGNTFYHPDMRFRYNYPNGWKLVNSPIQVQMAPSDGRALMIFTNAQGNSLQEAAQNTIKQLNLRVQDSKQTTVNGMPAIAVLSVAVQQNQQTGQQVQLNVLSYFIQHNNSYLVFHGLSTAQDFNSYYRIMEQSMLSFNKLTDAAKINVQPDRVRIKKTTREQTVADALRSFGVPEAKLKEHALLNNWNLTDRVIAGSLIKVIEK